MIGYGWYFFRNINITGEKGPPVAWDATQQVPVHSFEVGLSSEDMPSGCVAPNGDVLLAAGNKLVRSKDKGRTWGPPETLPGQARQRDRLWQHHVSHRPRTADRATCIATEQAPRSRCPRSASRSRPTTVSPGPIRFRPR